MRNQRSAVVPKASLACRAFLIASCASIVSASPDAPRGLFCSCPPTNTNSHSVLEDVAALDHVDGTLLRVGWDALEPTPGDYDWSLLDAELARAEQFDTDVALAIVLGNSAPAWLEQAGAETITVTFFDQTFERYVPWDSVLLSNWTEMIARAGARYDGHPRIKIVHITHETGNGFEMQLRGTLADWQTVGYTHERYTDSYKAVIDAFAAAFPSHPLDVDVHPVLDSDAVAQDVAEYGLATIGQRFGILAAWWTQNNAQNVYPAMNTILLDAPFSAIQVARSETVHGPEIFGEGGLSGALQLAIDSGIGYAEVWNADLLNPSLQPSIVAFAEALDDAAPCGDADLAEPFGVLDLADINAFLTAFQNAEPAGDLTCDGVFDLADLGQFVGAFVAGCP